MVTERKRRRKLPRVKTIELPTSKQTRATSLNHRFVFFFLQNEMRNQEAGSVTDPPLLDDSSRCVRRSPFPVQQTSTGFFSCRQTGVNQTAAQQNQSEFLSAPTGARVKPQQQKKKKGQYVLRHVHRHVLCVQKANTNGPDEAAYQSTLNNPEQEPAKRKLLDEQTHHCLSFSI